MELLQSFIAPKALLFASTLQGPAAYLSAPNKTPRARYSAQSVSKASPCSLTEAESQMRRINEQGPPALTSARREESRRGVEELSPTTASVRASTGQQPPNWMLGVNQPKQTSLAPCCCAVGSAWWVQRGGWCPWAGQKHREPCHLPAPGSGSPWVLPGPCLQSHEPSSS